MEKEDLRYVELVDGEWVQVELFGRALTKFTAFTKGAKFPENVDVIGATLVGTLWKIVGTCSFCGRLRQVPKARVNIGTVCNCQKVNKHKATCLERYGVEYSSQAEEVKEKIKSSMMDKYGVESIFDLPEVRAKCQAAYAGRGDEIRAKVIATNQAKYGVDSTLSLKSVREKQSNTRFNKFVSSVKIDDTDELVRLERGRSGHKIVVKCTVCGKERKVTPGFGCHCLANEKSKATCQERYGVDSTNELEWKKEKARKTNLERYGVEFASQNTEIKRRILLSHHNTMRKNRFQSRQEREVAMFVESLGLSQRKHASSDKEIDVFIESKMVGIEFNGTYWHSEAQNKGRSFHINKTREAAKNGIELIHVWSHLWMTRRTQIESFLRAKLGKCSNRIGVRKCVVKEISKADAIKFVDTYHIQGANQRIDLAIGAFVGEELVAVSTFSPHHRGGEMKTLSRLCTKTDWVVSGFLGKAVRLAFAKFGPIVSWVDLCLSTGKSYLAAGFKLDGKLSPDYAYVKGGGHKIIKKQSFRKIDERSERQRATDEKLHRFWDCGKLRFIFDGK